MIKNRFALFIVFLLCSLFAGCALDDGIPVNYDNAVPVKFNIQIVNNTGSKKQITLDRTNADSECFSVSAYSTKTFKNVVCIDETWQENFTYFYNPTGRMRGTSEISLNVGSNKISIGRYSLCNMEVEPTYYGKFISGALSGKKSGTVKLKLTIYSTNKSSNNLKLTYL